MNAIEDLIQSAKNKLQVAEMALETYDKSKNPKLLLAAVQNTYIALNKSASAILLQLDKTKTIDDVRAETLDKKVLDLQKRNLITYDELKCIREMKEIIVKNKKSGMVFPRKGNLVICEDDYEMIILSKENTESYLNKAKVFIKKLFSISPNT